MKRWAWITALALAGCGTTQGLAPQETRSGFDGARVVTIDGHGAACQQMVCPGLGAQWSSTTPDQAIVSAYVFNRVQGITGAALSIDGQVHQLRALPGLTSFSRVGDPLVVSRSDFVAPLATVRAAAAARRVWLRLSTTDGALEAAIIDGDTDSKAVHALRRFVAQIDASPAR